MITLLPRPVLDHSLIILEGGGVRSSKTPCRFENMRLKVDEFKDLVKGWWEGYQFSGSSSFILASKLKAFKEDIKVWNKGVFGNGAVRKACALDQINFLDAKEREGRLSTEDMDARRLAVEDYSYWAVLEETSWRQKYQEVWLKEGDKKYKVFSQNGQCKVQ